MFSVLDSGLRGLGLSPSQDHYVVFSGKTLYSHSAPLHPGVLMVPTNCQINLMKCWGVSCDGLVSHPGVAIFCLMLQKPG